MFFKVALAALLILFTQQAHAAGTRVLEEADAVIEAAETTRNLRLRKPPKEEAGHHGVARFRGLNKLTAQKQEVHAALGIPGQFATLEIRLRDCWQAGPGEVFEAKALVEIWENRPQLSSRMAQGDTAAVVARRKLFHGWMVASQPALSGLEHPVYDLVLLGCVE